MLSTTLKGSQKGRWCVPDFSLPVLREGQVGMQLIWPGRLRHGMAILYQVGLLCRKSWWGLPLRSGVAVHEQFVSL